MADASICQPRKVLMWEWLRRLGTEKERRAAMVEADAKDLIARFGGDAYYVALDRSRAEGAGATVDGNRPTHHWTAVKARIARLTSREVGLDTATRYLRE